MKVVTNDGGATYHITEANLTQDSNYAISIIKEGYRFTVPDIYVPIPYQPVPIITTLQRTGKIRTLVIKFDYNMPNLLLSDLNITPSVNINTLTSSDNGLSYVIQGEFEGDTNYTFTFNKYGYNFKNKPSIVTLAEWKKMNWKDVLSSLGITMSATNRPLGGKCFLKKFYVVCIGNQNTDTRQITNFIITQDFIHWAKLETPVLDYWHNYVDFRYWAMRGTRLLILCPDGTPGERYNYGSIWRTTIQNYNDTLNWEVVMSEYEFEWLDEEANYEFIISPTCFGISGSYMWCSGPVYTNYSRFWDVVRMSYSVSNVDNKGFGKSSLTRGQTSSYRAFLHYTQESNIRWLPASAVYTNISSTAYAQSGISSSSYTTNIVSQYANPYAGNPKAATTGWDYAYDNGNNQYVSYINYKDSSSWIFEMEDGIKINSIPYPFNTDNGTYGSFRFSSPSNGYNSRTNEFYITFRYNENILDGLEYDTAYYTDISYSSGAWKKVWFQQISLNLEKHGTALLMGNIIGLNDEYYMMNYLHDVSFLNSQDSYYLSPKNYEFARTEYNIVYDGS